MKNKKNIVLVVGFVVVALVFFLAGSSYGKKNALTANNQNVPGQLGRAGGAGARGMRAGSGFVNGQIIAVDANSVTVELKAMGGQNGTPTTGATAQGSKIVFYTGTTSIMKTTDGTVSDLAVGKQVSITGTANPDGSVNAQSIQIRPTAPIPAQ